MKSFHLFQRFSIATGYYSCVFITGHSNAASKRQSWASFDWCQVSAAVVLIDLCHFISLEMKSKLTIGNWLCHGRRAKNAKLCCGWLWLLLLLLPLLLLPVLVKVTERYRSVAQRVGVEYVVHCSSGKYEHKSDAPQNCRQSH